jgi:hypothetical protein
VLALTRRAARLAALGFAAALHGVAGLGVVASLATAPAAAPPPRPVLEVRWIATPASPAQAITEPRAITSPAGPPASFAPPPADSLAEAPRGPEFLASDEVDEPARPLDAWTLDAEALSALGITRIVFDVWVDKHAALVGLRVVRMEPAASAGLAPLVEARLAGTPMAAALMDGRPVAHRQRIDLAWERTPATPGPGPV